MPGQRPCPPGCACGVHTKRRCSDVPGGCGCRRHHRSALHNELISRGLKKFNAEKRLEEKSG